MRITFNQDFRPAGQAEGIPTYEKDRTYDFAGPVAETYARKYIARGLAAPTVGEKPKRDPLDHDGDGRKGGSVPAQPAAEEATVEPPADPEPPAEPEEAQPAAEEAHTKPRRRKS